MTSRRSQAWHALVIAFCLWHMLAIGIYAMPWNARDAISPKIRSTMNRVLAPYTLSFSQWQQWDLFSPDPLRRVSWYRVDRATADGGWESVARIGPDAYPWWRHGTYAKLLLNLFEQDTDLYRPAIANLAVQHVCTDHQLEPGTELRLTYEGYVVLIHPDAGEGEPSWSKSPFTAPGLITACPS